MRQMKDSGIEWIGEIPNDWIIKRCKYLSCSISGYAFDSNLFETDYTYPVIRIGDIQNGMVDFDNCLGINDNSDLEEYLVKPRDVLIAMSGATVGKVGYYDEKRTAYVNQRVGIIRSVMSKYIFSFVNSYPSSGSIS